MTMHVLLIEDSDKDAALIIRELRKTAADMNAERVDNRESLDCALKARRWDIILADYELPSFDALHALEIIRAHDAEVSYVIVSGTIGEDVAVNAMRAGAQDYIMKDKLRRLGPVVMREVAETKVRRERARAIAALRASEARQRLLVESGARLVHSLDDASMLQGIAELVVGHVADGCAIELFDNLGNLQRVATATRRSLGNDALEIPPRIAQLANVTSQAVREGKSAFDPQASSGGIGWYMVAPMVAREKPLGAITVIHTPGQGVFGPEDLHLVEELAARCAMAVDNARLFEQVRESVRLRDEFIAIAAHELRTPLTPLRMQAESLMEKVENKRLDDLTPARLAMPVRRLVRSSDRLIELVERLLDFSRLTISGLPLKLGDYDLVALALEVVGELSSAFEQVGSEVSWNIPQTPIVGRWDAHRIKLALRHLLENAMKFAPGKPIEVTIDETASVARLTVKDCGPGLSFEDQARLFERYQRPAPIRNYGGFGLGLWIVRRVADEHGGRVEVSSAPNEGAEFVLLLPRFPLQSVTPIRTTERPDHDG